jgi:hypothetical protein
MRSRTWGPTLIDAEHDVAPVDEAADVLRSGDHRQTSQRSRVPKSVDWLPHAARSRRNCHLSRGARKALRIDACS